MRDASQLRFTLEQQLGRGGYPKPWHPRRIVAAWGNALRVGAILGLKPAKDWTSGSDETPLALSYRGAHERLV
jgi:hypothetical protein